MTTLATAFDPRHYDAGLGSVQFGPFAAELAARLPVDPGGDVLEIAAGTGLLTMRLRERLHSARHLIATDLNARMLAFARTRLARLEGLTFDDVTAGLLLREVTRTMVTRRRCWSRRWRYEQSAGTSAELKQERVLWQPLRNGNWRVMQPNDTNKYLFRPFWGLLRKHW